MGRCTGGRPAEEHPRREDHSSEDPALSPMSHGAASGVPSGDLPLVTHSHQLVHLSVVGLEAAVPVPPPYAVTPMSEGILK